MQSLPESSSQTIANGAVPFLNVATALNFAKFNPATIVGSTGDSLCVMAENLQTLNVQLGYKFNISFLK